MVLGCRNGLPGWSIDCTSAAIVMFNIGGLPQSVDRAGTPRRSGWLSNGSVFLATFMDRIDDRWRWLITIALAAGAAIYAFWPVARLTSGWNDSSFLYAAGRTWTTGFSPYDFERWNAEWTAVRPITEVAQPMPFVYPPHWGPVAVLLAQLPWPVASRVWDVVNVVAYLGAGVFTLRICGGHVRELAAKPAVWMFLAIATLNVAVRQSVFQGQFTIVPLLGIAGAFWAWHEKKTTWLVLFAFVASLKPQLGLLPLLYLFLNGGHVACTLGGRRGWSDRFALDVAVAHRAAAR